MSINQNITTGDYVKHLNDPLLNGGLAMSVVEVNEEEAKIGYFDQQGIHKEVWVNKIDLVLDRKAEGGFRDAGERP